MRAEEPAFRRCDGCTYDFQTGEGRRSCTWYACPYLPDTLDVFCPECNYNFYTKVGNPRCSDPPTCGHAVIGWEHAERAAAHAELAAPVG